MTPLHDGENSQSEPEFPFDPKNSFGLKSMFAHSVLKQTSPLPTQIVCDLCKANKANKQASKQAGKQARKQAREQTSKKINKQANKQASKQADRQVSEILIRLESSTFNGVGGIGVSLSIPYDYTCLVTRPTSAYLGLLRATSGYFGLPRLTSGWATSAYLGLPRPTSAY